MSEGLHLAGEAASQQEVEELAELPNVVSLAQLQQAAAVVEVEEGRGRGRQLVALQRSGSPLGLRLREEERRVVIVAARQRPAVAGGEEFHPLEADELHDVRQTIVRVELVQEDDVLRQEIAEDDPQAVQVGEGGGDLLEEGENVQERELLPRDQVRHQLPAAQVLENDVALPVGVVGLVDGVQLHEIRVAELGEDVQLVPEVFALRRSVLYLGLLDRHLLRIDLSQWNSSVNSTASTFADFLFESKV
jgi:hypothetical protein